MKGIIWKPGKSYKEKSNVWRFMKKNGIKNYRTLVQWSQNDIEGFWDAVGEDLEIEWYKPYRKILDDSRGIEWSRWFVGGKINIAHNCLDKHAFSHRRNKVAIFYEGEDGTHRKITFWELYCESNRLAHALTEVGIRKGDRVGIFMPMVPEIVVAMLACAKVGAIFIPVFSGFGASAVASRLNDGGARLLFCADGFFRRGKIVEMKKVAGEAASLCPSLERMIILKHAGCAFEWDKRDVWWSDFVSGKSMDFITEEMDSEDPFMLIYTSGTTGKPKGSVHVHGGFLVKIAEEVAYQTDMQEEDILFWVTDMGWIMGPWEVVGGLALGGSVFLYDGAIDYPQEDRLWSMVERHGVTILGISPTAIRALMRAGDSLVDKHDLSALRILGSTGEPWDTTSYMWFFEHVGKKRCPIINISGGTEIVCFLSPLPITPLKPCTLVGPALGMDIDVYDEKGKSLRGEVGELVCTKPWPSMTRGIWGDPERFVSTYWSRFKDVWVHGDWASVDKDGFWFLHGRSDDTIKVAGKRVGPAEIEGALITHHTVSEAVAIGVPDEIKGETIVCFAVLKTGVVAEAKLKELLREHVAEELGKALKPKDILFVSQLPKTRNAKILRRMVKMVYLGNNVEDTSALANPEALEEIERTR